MLKSMSAIFTSTILLSSIDIALRDILSLFMASACNSDENPVLHTGSNIYSDTTFNDQLPTNPNGSNIIFDSNPTSERAVSVNSSVHPEDDRITTTSIEGQAKSDSDILSTESIDVDQKIPNPFTNDTQVGPSPAQITSVYMETLNRNDKRILNERNKFPKGPIIR